MVKTGEGSEADEDVEDVKDGKDSEDVKDNKDVREDGDKSQNDASYDTAQSTSANPKINEICQDSEHNIG
ncbi:14304_t:CDS:2 [Rhizophagus irregularis]|nr:14304_t:CDS:2 [Rhizophagus irregularis]